MPQRAQRFIGLDVHKAYVVVAAVDVQQTILLQPQRIAIDNLPDWLEGHLQPTDAVVLEACSMAWTIHDRLEPLAGQVTIAHAAHVKMIASSLIKTDKRDALVLARLLGANLIPPVWVPPPHVRQLRELVGHRRDLVEQRSATKSGCEHCYCAIRCSQHPVISERPNYVSGGMKSLYRPVAS